MSSTINVWVVSPDTRSERRFDLHTTIGNLKNKLELITGIPVQNQSIALYDSENDNQAITTLREDERQLGFYGVRDWQFLKVTDTDPSTSFTGQLNDVSQVEKFELSDNAYAQKQDTVLAYKQRNKIGRFAEKKEESEPAMEPEVDMAMTVGSRCEVESTEQDFRKRGTVRFVGKTEFGKGIWVGVEYDEPIGKNDGSVQGQQYFTCSPKYGVFVRPDKVRTGDYPVEEIDFEEEM